MPAPANPRCSFAPVRALAVVVVVVVVVVLLAGCAPVVLEADPCSDDQRAVGVLLDEPLFAPAPAGMGLLPWGDSPSVATDGTGFLVAWYAGSMVAVRLSVTGEVLDTPPLLLGTGGRYGQRPSLAYDGTDYLVVWNDSDGIVRATRVSRDGQVFDPGGVRLLGDTDVFALALATGGGQTLLAWVERTGTVVRLAAITGVTLGPAMELAFPRLKTFDSLALAGDGTTWALAVDGLSQTATLLSLLHFFESTRFAALADFELPRPGIGVALAAGGGKFLATWGASPEVILATLATPSGLEGLLTLTVQGRRHRAPAVSFDGARFQVAWQGWPAGASGQDLLSTSISTAGVVSVLDGALVDAHEGGVSRLQYLEHVSLASLGGRTLAVYGTRGMNERMTAAWLAPAGGGLRLPTPLSLTTEFRTNPRVVATSSGYVVLWVENTQEGYQLGGARLGPGGEFLALLDVAKLDRAASWGWGRKSFDATAVGDEVLAVTGGGILAPLRLEVLAPDQSQFALAPEFTFPDSAVVAAHAASSGTAALATWTDLARQGLWVRPLRKPAGGDGDAGPTLLGVINGIDQMALGSRDGGFGVVSLAEGRLHFLTLDLEGRLVGQSQLEGAGLGGPMLRLERDGAAVALLGAADGGASLLGAVAEHGTPSFPVVLGENQVISRFAHGALGTDDLLGWVISTDAGSVPHGARLTAELGAVGARPFVWALDAEVSGLDLATRSATEGVIAYAVNDPVKSTIAWRRFTVVDAGACSKATVADPPGFARVGSGCSVTDVAHWLWGALLVLRGARPRRSR